ncbi:PAP/fibrillin family protein [Gloeocapsa sp. PCC 73106]|uniref:PAP/fibrillin family protein n=1 Tax=Gloeocapsa sp. PCC 73106 TaxID=102232 RepID=UPI0002AC3608|nr:PAP/fibrillin family protein [Gloeocapsa sp. PCC 73106]ELS00014.1 fibrillin [Gloeocapsa sp. PCC 73106]
MSKKTALLEAIAGQNRGLLATEADKVRVLSLFQQLEDENPYPLPFQALNLLDGNWRLLYTTSRGILGLNRLPLLQLGQIYQYLRAEQGILYNIAEIVGIPLLEGVVSVCARFEVVSERRVNVRFERSVIVLQRLINYRSPLNFIEEIEGGKKFPPIDFNISNREQKGWLEITYLDEDIRLGRGNEGNIFVLAKEK